MINLVELAFSDDGHWDQKCIHGHRINGHAVYCHNDKWSDSPRKCRRGWPDEVGYEHEKCPGFDSNPNWKDKDNG